jgi:predicted nucleic acid-binding protein
VHGLTLAEIDMFMAAFASASEGVEVTFRWRPTMRDPNDEMVLEAAVNGRADALASHNVRDFHDAALRFDVRVVTPGILLREISP